MLPESPAMSTCGDTTRPRRRIKTERLRNKPGIKSTSEGRNGPMVGAVRGTWVELCPARLEACSGAVSAFFL